MIGAGGFVGRYLTESLFGGLSPNTNITLTSLHANSEANVRSLNILDKAAVREVLVTCQPTHVLNLAGLAAPRASRLNPDLAWAMHAQAPERIGRQILEVNPNCWLLNVGTGMVYGGAAQIDRGLTETDPLQPLDPYAVTKAAGDLALGALVGEGLRCIRMRPFNHIGPGQSEEFAVATFAAQISRIRRGTSPAVIKVGSLKAKRDFLDVRDVVGAYTRLIEVSDSLQPGAIYNISSGIAIPMSDILHELVKISGLEIAVEIDEARYRPSDIACLYGNSTKLQNDCGWKPRISLQETLTSIYQSNLTARD